MKNETAEQDSALITTGSQTESAWADYQSAAGYQPAPRKK